MEEIAHRLGILFVGTGKYINFFDGFFESFQRHWCPGVPKKFFVFSDVRPKIDDSSVVWLHTPFEPWPCPTLNRYSYFLRYAAEIASQTHLIFANSNLRPQLDIKFEELFDGGNNLFGVRHPGFAFAKKKFLRGDPGTFEANRRSTAYLGCGRKIYFAGGLNGGLTADWLRLSGYLSTNIELDKRRMVNGTGWAIWHDESHINYYFNRVESPRILGPEYLYPEGWEMPVDKKVLILDKSKLGGHDFLRDGFSPRDGE
jgi:hypothetical protein